MTKTCIFCYLHMPKTCYLPMQAGELENDEIFYTDKRQSRDHECLFLGCDNQPVLEGRTPVQTYADFIQEFAHQCKQNDLWGESPHVILSDVHRPSRHLQTLVYPSPAARHMLPLSGALLLRTADGQGVCVQEAP